jgi:class 3 adenylate cyclase
MEFYEVLDQVVALLKQRERVTYRAIKRQFGIDDDFLEDLKAELIQAQRLAIDEDGAVLVWTGEQESSSEPIPELSTLEPTSLPTQESEREPLSYTPPHLAEKILQSKSALEGERKQVTVLFCDLQNSTPLAETIGPENMHTLLNRFFEIPNIRLHL